VELSAFSTFEIKNKGYTMADLKDNLVDLIHSFLTPDVVGKAADYLGESRGSTEKAMGVAVPALLSAISTFAGSSSGANRLFDLIGKEPSGANLLSAAASLFTGGRNTETTLSAGKSLLDMVLGGRKSGFIDGIASLAGIKNSSASSLLGLLGPFILSFLRKHSDTFGLNASGLARVLTDQLGSFKHLLPAGITSLLGSAEAPRKVYEEPRAVTEERKPLPFWLWLLPLLLLGAGILGLLTQLRGCSDRQEVQTQAAKIGRALSSIALPSGVTLSVPEGGFNYNLVGFLKNPADTAVPRTFVFDDLNFQFATTNLTPESKKTVDDLVVILQAYPSAVVRLEGHTDNVGDAVANLKLSQDRASAIKNLLVSGGIDAARLSTDGFGQDRPIDTNDTDEGRAKNRRTELVVTSK
jgi:outer membrane protein OmpA-like peptidoglycan-associated protein